MGRFGRRFTTALAGAFAMGALAAPGARAETTVGVDVNHGSNGIGACGAESPANRPCVIFNTSGGAPAPRGASNQVYPVRSPCDGTVVRYRLNGVPSVNTYRLRAVTDNGNGTYTGTAGTAPVSIAVDGVNTYPASMPVKQGQFIGVDFQDSTVDALRWFYGGPGGGFSSVVIYSFPADGGADTPNLSEDSVYLFNADVSCSTAPPATNGPAATKCKKKKAKKKGKRAAVSAVPMRAQAKKKGCKKKKRRKKK
jgi:hypothetical protein